MAHAAARVPGIDDPPGTAVRQRLVNFYSQFNPENLNKVDRIVDAYLGEEDVLFEELAQEYAQDIRAFIRAAMVHSTVAASSTARAEQGNGFSAASTSNGESQGAPAAHASPAVLSAVWKTFCADLPSVAAPGNQQPQQGEEEGEEEGLDRLRGTERSINISDCDPFTWDPRRRTGAAAAGSASPPRVVSADAAWGGGGSINSSHYAAAAAAAATPADGSRSGSTTEPAGDAPPLARVFHHHQRPLPPPSHQPPPVQSQSIMVLQRLDASHAHAVAPRNAHQGKLLHSAQPGEQPLLREAGGGTTHRGVTADTSPRRHTSDDYVRHITRDIYHGSVKASAGTIAAKMVREAERDAQLKQVTWGPANIDEVGAYREQLARQSGADLSHVSPQALLHVSEFEAAGASALPLYTEQGPTAADLDPAAHALRLVGGDDRGAAALLEGVRAMAPRLGSARGSAPNSLSFGGAAGTPGRGLADQGRAHEDCPRVQHSATAAAAASAAEAVELTSRSVNDSGAGKEGNSDGSNVSTPTSSVSAAFRRSAVQHQRLRNVAALRARHSDPLRADPVETAREQGEAIDVICLTCGHTAKMAADGSIVEGSHPAHTPSLRQAKPGVLRPLPDGSEGNQGNVPGEAAFTPAAAATAPSLQSPQLRAPVYRVFRHGNKEAIGGHNGGTSRALPLARCTDSSDTGTTVRVLDLDVDGTPTPTPPTTAAAAGAGGGPLKLAPAYAACASGSTSRPPLAPRRGRTDTDPRRLNGEPSSRKATTGAPAEGSHHQQPLQASAPTTAHESPRRNDVHEPGAEGGAITAAGAAGGGAPNRGGGDVDNIEALVVGTHNSNDDGSGSGSGSGGDCRYSQRQGSAGESGEGAINNGHGGGSEVLTTGALPPAASAAPVASIGSHSFFGPMHSSRVFDEGDFLAEGGAERKTAAAGQPASRPHPGSAKDPASTAATAADAPGPATDTSSLHSDSMRFKEEGRMARHAEATSQAPPLVVTADAFKDPEFV